MFLVEVIIENGSIEGRCRLSTQCPVCGDEQILAIGERRWCRKEVVRKVKKHMKLAHDRNPDEYQIKFSDWF